MFSNLDLGLQADVALRLLISAVLGAAIGIEREIHSHPAGMRTHLLVSLGAATFTALGDVAFRGAPGEAAVDPTRIAAQVVTGIGFLGGGAILKYGTSVKGLTTAASLWATAAVGMAAGAGQWLIGVVAAAIVVFSLWPLHRLTTRIRPAGGQGLRILLETGRLEALGDISRLVADRHVELASVNSQRLGKGRYEVDLDLRLPRGVHASEVVAAINDIANVELIESGTPGD